MKIALKAVKWARPPGDSLIWDNRNLITSRYEIYKHLLLIDTIKSLWKHLESSLDAENVTSSCKSEGNRMKDSRMEWKSFYDGMSL